MGSWRGMRFPGRRTLWSFLRGVKTNYSWWSNSKTKWGLRGCKQAAHPVFFWCFHHYQKLLNCNGYFFVFFSLSFFSVTLGITSFFLFLFFFCNETFSCIFHALLIIWYSYSSLYITVLVFITLFLLPDPSSSLEFRPWILLDPSPGFVRFFFLSACVRDSLFAFRAHLFFFLCPAECVFGYYSWALHVRFLLWLRVDLCLSQPRISSFFFFFHSAFVWISIVDFFLCEGHHRSRSLHGVIRAFVCVVSLWESEKWNNHNSNDTHKHTRREKKKELAPFLNTTRLVFFSLTVSTVRALGVSCWPDLSFVLVCACAVSCTSVFFQGSVSLCLRDWRRWRPRFKVALQSALRKTVQVKVVLALQISNKYAFIENSKKHTHAQKKQQQQRN